MTTGIAEATEVRTRLFGVPLVDLPKYTTAPPIGNRDVKRADFVNFALLDEILAYVQNHPDQWNQDDWFKIVDLETGSIRYEKEEVIVKEVNSCGAAMCFAGHAALRMGFPAPPKDNGKIWTRAVKDPEDGYEYDEEVFTFAQNVLGLTSSQADALFAGANTLDDLQNIVEALHLNPKLSGYALEELRDAIDYIEGQTVREYLERNGYSVA